MSAINVTAKEANDIRRLVEIGYDPDAALAEVRKGAPAKAKKKGHKYGAKPVVIDGHKFPSQAEGRRYRKLKELRDEGVIRDLELQPRYPIRINGVLVTTYIGDFRYVDTRTGETKTEDVKGFVTDVYKLKRKLMQVVNGIEIQEIKA